MFYNQQSNNSKNFIISFLNVLCHLIFRKDKGQIDRVQNLLRSYLPFKTNKNRPSNDLNMQIKISINNGCSGDLKQINNNTFYVKHETTSSKNF